MDNGTIYSIRHLTRMALTAANNMEEIASSVEDIYMSSRYAEYRFWAGIRMAYILGARNVAFYSSMCK